MNAVEFTTELSGAAVLPIPRDIAAQLPKSGKARIIVLTDEDTDEAEWRAGAYEQFLRDDSAEDAAGQAPSGAFVVTTTSDAWPNSVGAARMGFWPLQPPWQAEPKRIHAAPTELGGSCGTCGYKHGAPNGAFRIAAATPWPYDRCV
jgi:hypothetical protein